MIYYKHYIGDYQRHTGHLSLAQDGAYRRMMDHYYSTEQPLPADRNILNRICGAMEKVEREAVDFVAKAFFREFEGHLHHERIDEEVSIAQEKIANLKVNAQAGGKQSGKSRSSKSEADGEANASANAQAETNNKSEVSSQSKPNGLGKNKAQLSVALPSWLPKDLWKDWVSYRKSIKAPLTQRAAELCIGKLEKLRAEGHDPRAVIENSVMSGRWTGLFAPKPEATARGSPSNRPAKFDPVAHVNRTRNEPNERTITFDESGEPV